MFDYTGNDRTNGGNVVCFNPSPAIYNNCYLLSLLLMYFGCINCEEYGPILGCSLIKSQSDQGS